MKQILSLKIIIILSIILACGQSETNNKDSKPSKTLYNQEFTHSEQSNIDESQKNETELNFIKIKELTIGNKVSWQTTIEEIKNNFEIDSIVPLPKYMELSDADKLIYVGKSYFHYFEERNYCEVGIIVFDEKIKNITLNGEKIQGGTTSKTLSKNYPNCNQTGEIDIQEDDSKYKMCHVDIEDIDMQLLFFFTLNKLKRMDVWYPS